jgi:hypothetical protein
MDAGLSESESFHLLQALLGIIREKGVVDLPETLDISDPIFAPRNFVFRMRETSDGRILGWSPAQGRTNARLNYLSRVLNDNEESPLTREILGKLWTELTSRISPWVTLFSVDQARSVPSLCLNYKMFDFRAVDSSDVLFVCDTCKRVTLTNVRNICPRYRCSGHLVTTSEAGGRRDHYEALYTKQLPIGMKVEEHTAQLSTEHASDIQQDFVDGRVNTLSCSTTFELGVDLGEIRAVLMKNVPPTAANYAQRAGRAGRRTSSTALVTTFAQRRNHDLFYFSNPEGLVNGVVQAPQISVSNTLIIRRHVHSVALASFARQYVDEGGEWSLRINVGEFFHDITPDGMTLAERFEFWLRSGPETLSKSLTRIIDDEASSQGLGISEWQWVEDLYADTTSTEKGWMRRAESVITELLTNIEKLITEKEAQLALERRGTGKAIALSRSLELLNKQAKTVRERRLIDYLAQMIVLPKYGFPVDVVSLDILSPDSTEGSKLELTRDLQVAILDFAPSSTTVANKRLWESNGLRIPQDKALPEFHWRVCIKCDTFRTLKEPGNDLGCDVCGSHEVKPHSPAIVPSFGFLGRPSEEKPGDARPSRVGYLRSYFTEFGGQLPELETIRIGTGSVGVRVGREGVITVLNQGPRNSGFDICLRCGGATVPSPAKKRRRVTQDEEPHSRPGLSKSECKTHRHRRVLGHQFRTDAIQIDLPGVVSYSQGESVLAALVAATQKLDIPRDDIKGTTRAGGGGLSRSIVIFDAVPGGAGYARAVRDALPDMFAHAAAISNNCSCGVETSCYGCLRSYSNQFVHESLSRREANSVFTSLGLID